MAKMTQTKAIRTYSHAISPGVYAKRESVLPALPLKSKECPVCHNEMKVADGQVMRVHKQCKRLLSRTSKTFRSEKFRASKIHYAK